MIVWVIDWKTERRPDWERGGATVVQSLEEWRRGQPDLRALVLCHAGNREFAEAVDESGRETICDVAAEVCAAGGRVIVFSGGAFDVNVDRLRDWLMGWEARGQRAGNRDKLTERTGTGSPFREGVHFAFVSAAWPPDAVDIATARLREMSSDFSVDDVVRTCVPQRDTLSALCVLAQGFLAVHAEKDGDGWGPPEIREALEAMKWAGWADEHWAVGTAMDGRKRMMEEGSGWWTKVVGTCDWIRAGIEGEWVEGLGDRQKVLELVEALDRREAVDSSTVAAAYLALAAQLRAGER